MEATVPGMNRTGAGVSPAGTQAMDAAADMLSPPIPIDTTAREAERRVYINEAESVGSIPPPLTVTGVVKTGIAKLKGSNPSIFMDKLGERIAFERAGVRLYEALVTKYKAAAQQDPQVLRAVEQASGPGAETLAASTKLHALTLVGGEHQTHDCYMNIGPIFADPMARQLYAEIASVESQHTKHYGSMLDPMESGLSATYRWTPGTELMRVEPVVQVTA